VVLQVFKSANQSGFGDFSSMNMNPPPAAGNKNLPSPQGAQKQAKAFGLVQFPSALIQSPDLGVFLQVYEGNAQFFRFFIGK